MQKPKLIILAGPTAVGKTDNSIRLAKAVNGEIISADSMQVYKRMDIGSAKIMPGEMQGIKHYLIDVLEPDEDFSAGKFVDMAKSAIAEIANKGKMPIIVGGTGLYLKMLLDGMNMPQGEPDLALRTELQEFLNANGNNALYALLCELDSEFAKKLHPNDTYKVMRAIEILKTSNTTMNKSRGYKKSEFNVLKIALGAKDRDVIYSRINNRVDKMVELGLEHEARKIFDSNPNLKSFHATIGYQEFVPYFSGECDLKTVIEKIKQNTRRYAKRQLTWFRAQPDIYWFNIDELAPQEIEEQVLELYKNFI